MPDEITPALTPEQWWLARGAKEISLGEEWLHVGNALIDPRLDRHALAALALHGQPFGFTHEDVDELREAYEADPLLVGRDVLDIADRIAALLPPREDRQ
jgi:hypothetical protein